MCTLYHGLRRPRRLAPRICQKEKKETSVSMASHNHTEAYGKITQEQLESPGQELSLLPPNGFAAIDEQALEGVQGGGGRPIPSIIDELGSSLSRVGSSLSHHASSL